MTSKHLEDVISASMSSLPVIIIIHMYIHPSHIFLSLHSTQPFRVATETIFFSVPNKQNQTLSTRHRQALGQMFLKYSHECAVGNFGVGWEAFSGYKWSCAKSEKAESGSRALAMLICADPRNVLFFYGVTDPWFIHSASNFTSPFTISMNTLLTSSCCSSGSGGAWGSDLSGSGRSWAWLRCHDQSVLAKSSSWCDMRRPWWDFRFQLLTVRFEPACTTRL